MDEVQWIKIYLDMFDRRKINKIRRLPAGNDILLFWVMLLVTAGKCNAGGMIFITERIPFTKEDLADEFDFEISTIELALKAFVEFDMVSIDDEGFIEVCNWAKYQNTDKLAEIREQNRERKRLQRERQKQALLNESQDSHVTVTGRHAIEEEREEDSEKESHSFIHARESDDDADEPVENSPDRESLKLKYLGGSLGKGVVMLSDEQVEDLLDKLSIEEFNRYVEAVAECELNGKHYKKTHYQAILDMVKHDRKVK